MRNYLIDSGLQAERTRLAWRRSVMSLVVASLVCLRGLTRVTGASAIFYVAVALSCIVIVSVVCIRRSRVVEAALRVGRALPGGAALCMFAGACSVSAMSAIAILASSLR
ncbi:DUF202 domain-containing protein [Mycolicibacterium goodii]|uniref:DUF202 domain-containing protein n=1 Tax=Mycolicibacterium goodii TaxID=134601 RepID=A0A0K0X2G2_MYCGD|nr:hypothetical protein AFA91_05805 [Mycolicibacterium goodii]